MIAALASRALAAHWRLQRARLALDSALVLRRLAYRRARCCGLGRLVSFLCVNHWPLPGGRKSIYQVEALSPGPYLNSPEAWTLVATIAADDLDAAADLAIARYSARYPVLRVIPFQRR